LQAKTSPAGALFKLVAKVWGEKGSQAVIAAEGSKKRSQKI